MNKIRPGHGGLMQSASCRPSPEQFAPPYIGAGSSQVLSREVLPGPQTGHEAHEDHADHSPSTEVKRKERSAAEAILSAVYLRLSGTGSRLTRWLELVLASTPAVRHP